MKTIVTIAVMGMLVGCSSVSLDQQPSRPAKIVSAKSERVEPVSISGFMTLDRYKRILAQQIVDDNPEKIYPGNPQAMLRSVVVVKYIVDADGRLVYSDTLRSNGDGVTVRTALSALRNAAPFPQPSINLLSHGRLEILETMLFNDDGRFQLRSIAAPQLD